MAHESTRVHPVSWRQVRLQIAHCAGRLNFPLSRLSYSGFCDGRSKKGDSSHGWRLSPGRVTNTNLHGIGRKFIFLHTKRDAVSPAAPILVWGIRRIGYVWIPSGYNRSREGKPILNSRMPGGGPGLFLCS